jgi:hypothetical protein
MDSWEEGFDKWTPRTPKAAESADETGADLDRDELLRLARELAEQRQAPVVGADSEIVQLKQSLRERAEAVAVRERELTELQRKLERDRPGIRTIGLRPKRADAVDGEVLAARERATAERTHALDDRERAVAAEAAELEAEAARLAEREAELAEELRTVQTTLAATEAERKLAAAEREQLEERDRAIHEREKTLAAARLELAAEREQQEARARDLERQAAALAANDERPAPDHAAEAARERAALAALEERELALADRESKLEDSERELALRRRELEAERNSLLERERRRRRIDVAEERDPVARPFAPPSFSEGLASLARSRSRG